MAERDDHELKPGACRALDLLERLCPPDRLDLVTGDLIEQYVDHLQQLGPVRARLLLWLEVLHFLRPGARCRDSIPAQSRGPLMFSNYLTIALRNLRKHARYAAINVIGLAVGLASFILIILFVRFELSYDRFHTDADRIHRILRSIPEGGLFGDTYSAALAVPIGETIRADVPGVESVALQQQTSGTFETEGNQFNQSGLYVEPPFLDIFSFPVMSGDSPSLLASPESIVFTRSTAGKFFGDIDPIGRDIIYRQYGTERTFTVTGVVADPPANSSLQFDFLMPMSAYDWFERNRDAWSNRSLVGYVLLRRDASVETVERQISTAARARMADDSFYASNPDRVPRMVLQPLTREHLHSFADFRIASDGDIRHVVLFLVIGLLILLIACVNYTNLATARAVTRAKEIGVRKVAGAYRSHLIQQFLGESLLTVVVAVLLGSGLASLLLPRFNQLVERSIPFGFPGDLELFGAVVLLGVVVGLLAGLYPALVMSRFDPIRAFGHRSEGGRRGNGLRNVLVVAQFTATIALIVVTVVIQSQLSYMLGTDTGLDRDRIVTVTLNDTDSWKSFDTLRQRLVQHRGIADVTASYHMPTGVGTRSSARDWEGRPADANLVAYNTGVSANFIEFFELGLVEGRRFKDDGSDVGRGLIINESARRALGWETTVGKSLSFSNRGTEVIGVVRDFHFRPLDQKIEPLILYHSLTQGHFVHVRIEPGDLDGTLAFLGDSVREIEPGYPFSYQFLDEAFGDMYEAEQRLGRLIGGFTILALVIASLGLFGLAAFSVTRRRREIGIRKVVGATATDIFLHLSKDFTRLVLIAFVLAAPLAYVAMQRWLLEFAYRIDLSIGVFVMVGASSLGVAWLTVAWQAYRAARTQPAAVLRSE